MAWFDTLLLKSSNPRMRCKAVKNLSESGHPSDTERIFASMDDPSPQVRCAAIRALAKANTPDAQDSLVHALRDACFEVRVAAARALCRFGDLRVAGDLAVCLRDPDAAVRIAAATALRAIGWKPNTGEELAWFEITLGNVPGPVSASAPAPDDQFTESNQDTSFYRRLKAVELQERNDPRKISSLLLALRGTDLLARVSAIHDLGRVKDPQITNELLTLFRNPDPEVRLAAAEVLAGRDDAPPAHFLGLLLDTSPEVRLVAVQFFGRIHAQQITEVLIPFLSDPSLQVRQAAAAAIGVTGDASAIGDMVVSLTHSNH